MIRELAALAAGVLVGAVVGIAAASRAALSLDAAAAFGLGLAGGGLVALALGGYLRRGEFEWAPPFPLARSHAAIVQAHLDRSGKFLQLEVGARG